MMMKNLSVIIPSYKEVKRIRPALIKISSYLEVSGIDYEVLVVIDGAAGETVKIIDGFGKKNIKAVINSKKREGKGAAIKRGVQESSKDWILTTDADLSTPVENLERLASFAGQYNIIIGTRDKNAKDNNDPFYRRIGGKIYNLIVRSLVIGRIKDTQCGFKLIKKNTAKNIFSKQKIRGFGFDVEMLYIARKYDEKIKEVPVEFINSRDSSVNYAKDSIKMLWDLALIKINDWSGNY